MLRCRHLRYAKYHVEQGIYRYRSPEPLLFRKARAAPHLISRNGNSKVGSYYLKHKILPPYFVRKIRRLISYHFCIRNIYFLLLSMYRKKNHPLLPRKKMCHGSFSLVKKDPLRCPHERREWPQARRCSPATETPASSTSR
jgi:hypothetical protein